MTCDYFAILVVNHTPEVVAHASTPEEMVDLLHGNAALRYLSVDNGMARTVQAACTRAYALAGRVALCDLPLFDRAKLFIQARL